MVLLHIDAKEMNSYKRDAYAFMFVAEVFTRDQPRCSSINQKDGIPSFVETNKNKQKCLEEQDSSHSTLETGKGEGEVGARNCCGVHSTAG